jgi:hypothetical protein
MSRASTSSAELESDLVARLHPSQYPIRPTERGQTWPRSTRPNWSPFAIPDTGEEREIPRGAVPYFPDYVQLKSNGSVNPNPATPKG